MLRKAATSIILALLALAFRRAQPPVSDFRPGRIAILRFGGFGDVVAVTSLIRAIRVAWPDALIDFITDQAGTSIVTNNPDITNIVIGRKPALTAHPGVILEAVRAMRQWSHHPYDLAFFTHQDFGNEFYPLFFRARFKVGFDIDDRGFDFAFTHSACIYSVGHAKESIHIATHFTDHFQRLLHAFTGADHAIERPVIRISDAELTAARAFLTGHGLDRNLVVLAPGGSHPIKIWPIERYAEVARILVADHDASVIVLLGPSEALHARHFADISGRFLFDAGHNSFRHNMAITHLADAMVCNDTGLMHVAAAFGVPAAAIFGPTPSAVFGYADQGHTIITADLPCVPCNDAVCKLLPDGQKQELAPCMNAVTPQRIVGTVVQYLTKADAS